MSVRLAKLITCIFLASFCTGCVVSGLKVNAVPDEIMEATEKATSITLYSIDPSSHNQSNPDQTLEGWDVLGKTALNKEQAKTILSELQSDAKLLLEAVGANCFNPRHGMEIKTRNDTYILMICYECSNADVYKNGKSISELDFTFEYGTPDYPNSILTKANIPLAKH